VTQDILSRAQRVQLAAFDVDGILTDGGLCYTDSGQEFKIFNVRDGHGIKMLQETGVEIAIITSRKSMAVEQRAKNLSIEWLFQGVGDKLEVFESLLTKLAISAAEASYMGDDVIDLPVLRRCGFAATVPEAPAIVREHVHYVTHAQGGRGAVREFSELLMQARGVLESKLSSYLR